jgi:hypothetical protein
MRGDKVVVIEANNKLPRPIWQATSQNNNDNDNSDNIQTSDLCLQKVWKW